MAGSVYDFAIFVGGSVYEDVLIKKLLPIMHAVFWA